MSGAIGPTTASYGILGALIANAGKVHQQLDTLTQQASNGLISTTYAGLGSAAGPALQLSAQSAQLQTWQRNIDGAVGLMGVTQTALTQVQQIAAQFAGVMPNLNGLNPSQADSIASQARDALGQVADLLNTKNGDTFVFSGQDGSNPPVPSPGNILNSGFYLQINAAVTALSSNGSAATVAATLQIASSDATGTTPFSAYLSQPASAVTVPAIDTGNGTSVRVGMLANANSGIVSTGTSTTGSYMRDLMRALATLGSMSSSQVNDPAFAGLVADTQASLNGAVSAMALDAGVMGNRQAGLVTEQTTMANVRTALATQIGNAQDVDMAATLSKLASVQTQLQASYKLIASANSMSLLNFLPAA
jgi:hypothetical protein